jgi:adenine-specific DNA-methyltransferase
LRSLIDLGYVSLGGFDAERNTWAISYLSKEPQEQIAAGILEIASFDEKRNVVDVVYADADSTARRIKTVWHRTTHDAGVGGTDVITGLTGGRTFSFPKSVYAVRDTIAMLTQSNPDAVIVDFFGGSGTTTHSTMMLNAEDGGRRRSILVTNNEVDIEEQASLRAKGDYPGSPNWEQRGIFYRATKSRIEAAILGVRADGSPVPHKLKNADGTRMSAGFKENVEFFELTYLDHNSVARGKAFEAVAPLLWMKFGALGPIIDKAKKPFAAPKDANYAVLFDINRWPEFIEALRGRTDVRYACVVTDSLAQFQQVVAEMPQGMGVSMLYEDYLRNFEINTGEER